MKQKWKVIFATGSRAEYGIVKKYLKKMATDENIDLSILVTGSLLSDDYGHQVNLIYQDGFNIEAEIGIPVNSSSNKSVIHSMAVALDKFGEYFCANQPNLLIILGDRYEMLSVATAAAMNRIPILHIHGGEATFGNYDEFIRHAITKMSLYHFTVTEEYKNRVIQLGESPERVFNLGSLGAENCIYSDVNAVPKYICSFKRKKYFVVLFHPETITNINIDEQIEELLKAIDNLSEYEFVFLGSNSDTHSNLIRTKVKEYVAFHDNCYYFENLPTEGYHFLLKHSLGLIGNSSSGLIEAPSLGTYTVNIGKRQEGRVRGNSVIDIPCAKEEILKAINKIIHRKGRETIINPYYKKNAVHNYYTTTLRILKELQEEKQPCVKHFFDISF